MSEMAIGRSNERDKKEKSGEVIKYGPITVAAQSIA
jgi:hypothetical protein